MRREFSDEKRTSTSFACIRSGEVSDGKRTALNIRKVAVVIGQWKIRNDTKGHTHATGAPRAPNKAGNSRFKETISSFRNAS